MGVAVVLCLGAIVVAVVVPQSRLRYEKKVYRVGEPIASFTLNAYIVRYHQRSEPFDSARHSGIDASGYTVVNVVEWTAQPRRTAAVLAVLAGLVILNSMRPRLRWPHASEAR